MKYLSSSCALTAAIGLLGASAVQGQTIFASEDFDSYALGSSLHDAGAAGNGWGGSWGIHNNGAGTNYVVSNTSPMFSGQYVAGDTTNDSYNYTRRTLDVSTDGPFGAYVEDIDSDDYFITSGVFYIGASVRLDSSAQTMSLFGVDGSTFTNGANKEDSMLYVGKFDSSGNWGVQYSTISDAEATTLDSGVSITSGQTERVVMQLDLDNDTAEVWFNPSDMSDSSTSVTFNSADDFRLISTRGYRNIQMDEVAITDNFEQAMVPEPSTYAAIAGALALGLAFWRRRK